MSGNPSENRKRVSLSVNQKLELLRKLESGCSVSVLCQEYGVKKQTISDIRKSKDKLTQFSLNYCVSTSSTSKSKSSGNSGLENERKHMRVASNQDLENAVLKWFMQLRSSGINIRGVDLQSAAKKFADRLGVKNFKASDGWLCNFRNRHGLTNHITHGESASAPTSEIEPFKVKLNEIMKDRSLQLCQIYNGDESGIFWRSLPRNTQALRCESNLPGRKMSKDRFSALFCANADGTHKLKVVVVGKSARPRVLKDITNSLPVHYYNSKKAWFNLIIFEDWFFKKFIPSVRQFQEEHLNIPTDEVKALLILDNAPAHPLPEKLVSDDGNIRCLFLPPNVTSLLQPMDQGVIAACKKIYVRKYLQEVLVVTPEEEDDISDDTRGEKTLKNMKAYSLKSAIFNLTDAWNSVKKTTLVNSWNNLFSDEVENKLKEYLGDVSELHDDIKKTGETRVSVDDVRQWLEESNSDPGYQILNDDEIIAEIVSKNDDHSDDSDDEKIDAKKPKLSKVREAIDEVISYIDLSEDQDVQHFYENFRQFKELIIKKQYQSGKQLKINTFFRSDQSCSKQC